MGESKTAAAARAGIDIAPPAGMPVSKRLSQSKKGIGTEIVRRAAYGKVTVESIEKYLEALRQSGQIAISAAAANLSYSSIRNLRKSDPEFAEMEEYTKELWIAENIDEVARQIAQGEWKKPIIGGKDRDQVVAEESMISPQIFLAWARKFDPAYREKQEVDVNHKGGVLVVNAPAKDEDEWRNRHSRKVENVRLVDEPDSSGMLPAVQESRDG